MKSIDSGVEKLYPDMILLNIPKNIQNHKNLDRKELFHLFIQFKTLLKLSIAINKTTELIHLGIDWKTFHRGVPEMCIEGEQLAKNIFSVNNLSGSGYMTWEEFVHGMLTIKSEVIADKIDMFFKVCYTIKI